jgi:hypothetical protein
MLQRTLQLFISGGTWDDEVLRHRQKKAPGLTVLQVQVLLLAILPKRVHGKLALQIAEFWKFLLQTGFFVEVHY